jgi:hypothetical protein
METFAQQKEIALGNVVLRYVCVWSEIKKIAKDTKKLA